MRYTDILAALLAAILALAGCKTAMVQNCEQVGDWNLQISGCTTMIGSGKHSGRNLVVAYNNRGIAYDQLGEHRRAIEDYDQALRLDPGYLDTYNNRGVAYDKLGEHRRAIEDFDQALRLDPSDAVAYSNRAYARCDLGQVEASLDDRGQVIRLYAGAAEDFQRHLRVRGFYEGAINGNFDPASQKALREWTAAGCPTSDE